MGISQSNFNESIIEIARSSREVTLSDAELARKFYAEAYDVVSRLLQNCDEDFASAP